MSSQAFSLEQLVGKNLQGYTIHRLLNFDTLHAVYMAQQGSQPPVFVKVFLLPTDLSEEALLHFRERFLAIAGKLALLDHPHILSIYAYGEKFGYPYLVTPSVADTSSSLSQFLQLPFPPEHTLEIFQQIAAALDYARLQGVVHGSLESAHILLDREQNVQLTNFGLQQMLSLQAIEENERPYAHLFSMAGTFLGTPAYMAPEVVEGKGPDERSDIYSLGILLYELLSGSLPFTGEDPMAIAFEHIEQPVPSLRTLSPSLAEAVDLVIQQSLEYDPDRRYQTAGKLVAAFEQALQHGEEVDLTPARARLSLSLPSVPAIPAVESQKSGQRRGLLSGMDTSKAMPAAVESREGTGQKRGLLSDSARWKAVSPPALASPSVPVTPDGTRSNVSGGSLSANDEAGGWQLRPPIMTNHMPAAQAVPNPRSAPGAYPPLPVTPLGQPPQVVSPPVAQSSLPDVLPESETPWSGVVEKTKQLMEKERAEVEKAKQFVEKELADPLFAMSATSMMASEQSSSLSTPDAYTPVLPDLPNTPPPVILDKGRRRTLAVLATGGAVTLGLLALGGVSLTHFVQNLPKSTPTASTHNASISVPTQQKKHVIGKKSQQLNSAVKFTNPADRKASLLIHLPNGNFVAYESTCTHQAVTVVYDTKRHLLVCPRHHSAFNPAAKGKVLNGPATVPLKAVTLQVNSDGSVSTV